MTALRAATQALLPCSDGAHAFDFNGKKALMGTASSEELVWLEHSLLFFSKQSKDFGAKLWNGIAFKFTATPTALVGQPQAVDLNRIGVPPDDLTVPPFGPMERDLFTPGARWLTELRIESP